MNWCAATRCTPRSARGMPKAASTPKKPPPRPSSARLCRGSAAPLRVEGTPLSTDREPRRREEVTNGEQYPPELSALPAIRIYPYGVARNRLLQAAKRMGVPAIITREPGDAEVLITLRTYYRNRQQVILEAEARGVTDLRPARQHRHPDGTGPGRAFQPALRRICEW